MAQEKHALISVYNKDGIVEFARQLIALGWVIWASRGTTKAINEAGLEARDISDFTDEPPILDHRVVTLHHKLHAALLADPQKPEHLAALTELGVPVIDLVCAGLYPLRDEIAKPAATHESVVEMTDIGGPTILRSAAKGGRIVVCDPEDRSMVVEIIKANGDNTEFRQALAAKAEATVAQYCLNSAEYLGQGDYAGFVGELTLKLRYGENPRQQSAALYRRLDGSDYPLALHNFERVAGQEPSFINATDVERGTTTLERIATSFGLNFRYLPFIALGIKHGNCCGAGVGETATEALSKMIASDPEALTGGTVIVNFELTSAEAGILRTHLVRDRKNRFLDIVVAPGFTDGAIEALKRSEGRCQMYVNSELKLMPTSSTRHFRQVIGGDFITQDPDTYIFTLLPEWKGYLPLQTQRDVVLGWAIAATSNSNTIIITREGMMIGRGIGQSSRVMACKVALLYAHESGHSTEGAVAVGDSFFPFPDGPIVLAEGGIGTIFATSGSKNDTMVREEMEKRDVTFLQLPDAVARGFYGH